MNISHVNCHCKYDGIIMYHNLLGVSMMENTSPNKKDKCPVLLKLYHLLLTQKINIENHKRYADQNIDFKTV